MAKTVGMIMILLYGAGGEPGRGENPMTRLAGRDRCASHKAYAVAGDVENKYCVFT